MRVPALPSRRIARFVAYLGMVLVAVTAALSVANEVHLPSFAGLAIDDKETREIVAQPTLRRQIPRIRFMGDRRTYDFLVSHPPLATQLARRLHPPLERYTVTQVGEDLYTIEDLGALRGEARLVRVTDRQRVYWFKGEFRSLANLLRFTGRMVLVLDSREVKEGGRTYIESDPDFYLRIDHLFFGFLAKLLAPLVNLLIDRRVGMIAEASSKLFQQVAGDPEGLYREMATWKEVRPEDLEAYRRAFISREAGGTR
ncbi:MAG: hypothetical protein HYY12_04455 [Candidatus Methylomirabilis oxyfera]|nr:hypothetical protein [Candidatus Methylomirabilis oxyfera]